MKDYSLFRWNIILIIFLLFMGLGCSSSKIVFERFDQYDYLNVGYLVAGSPTYDHREIIQNAIDTGNNLYFPEGDYYLETKSSKGAFLLINSDFQTKRMLFASNAHLIVNSSQPTDYIKPAILAIIAKKTNIDSVFIDGISIEGTSDSHNILNTGILAFEGANHSIGFLSIINANISNVGHTGIHTQASSNYFRNITTSNCGKHGIGVINTMNRDRKCYFMLDGHLSNSDNGNSIDFSGPKTNEDAKLGYEWLGVVKNVVSMDSQHGIKVAGNWNLMLDSVQIIDSRGNGFFINVNTNNSELYVTNLFVDNARNNALNLQGYANSHFENLTITNSKQAIKALKGDLFFENVSISSLDSTGVGRRGIRVGSKVKQFTMVDFSISGYTSDEVYVMKLNSKNVLLRKGILNNDVKNCQIYLQDEVEDATVSNISFFSKSNFSDAICIENNEISFDLSDCISNGLRIH